MQEIKKINLSLEKIKTVTLADVSINNKGEYGIGASAVDYSDELYTYLRITDINDDGTLNKNDLKSVDDVDAKNYLLNENDVVFARTGNSTGKAYYYDKMDGELVYAGFLIKFSLDSSKINPKFMKYYVLSKDYKGWVNSMCTGSTRPNINAKMYGNMELILPPREQQDFLVNILGEIDNKIEINKMINKNLELYLFYIFDETFMNFEFNEFSNSQDKIPLSWNLGTFNDIIESLGSGDWGKDELTGNYTSEVYCIRGADIPDVKQGNKGKMPIRYILSKNFQNKKLNENTIVLEISGGSPTQSTGRTVFITEDFLNRFDKDLICTNFCKVIKPALNYEIFIYLYFNYLYDKDVMFAYENGTTGIKNFDIKSFINNFLIVIPSQEDVINFNKLVKDVFDILMHNGLEIEKLQQLRDTLLPKLMSGEIDVSKINCDLELKYNYMKYLFNQIHTPMSKSVV